MSAPTPFPGLHPLAQMPYTSSYSDDISSFPSTTDIPLLTRILAPTPSTTQTTTLMHALPSSLLFHSPLLSFFPFANPTPRPLCHLHAPLNPSTINSIFTLLATELAPRIHHLLSAPASSLHPTTQAVLARLERLAATLQAQSQRRSNNCVACALALVPADVAALTALRATLLSRRKRGRPRPRLLAWVEGWVEGMAEEVGEEVREVSGREGREMMRDRRALRRERKGGEARVGGEADGGAVGGREGTQESEEDGWEEEVVDAYRSPAGAEESRGLSEVRPGGEAFSSRNGDVERGSRIDTAEGNGDAETRAEEYRRLLSPRPEPETPVSSRGSIRHDWRPAQGSRERESDIYETRETTARKATATRRRHGH